SREVLVPVRTAVAFRVADAVLARPTPGAGGAGLAAAVFLKGEAVEPLGVLAWFVDQEADLWGVRGLLSLEAGEGHAARKAFRTALDVWGGPARAASGAGLDFATRPIAEQQLDAIEQAGPPKDER